MWFPRGVVVLFALATSASIADAQQHQHVEGMRHPGDPAGTGVAPQQSGQAAYAAIGEIVRILEADPSTDWERVDIERLRRHLADMDAVTVRAAISQRNIPGGFQADVTGEGSVVGSIRRMAGAHFSQSDATQGIRARVEEIPGGSRVTVVVLDPADAARVARLRGLGFIGLLTQTEHHGPHHLAMARGRAPHGDTH